MKAQIIDHLAQIRRLKRLVVVMQLKSEIAELTDQTSWMKAELLKMDKKVRVLRGQNWKMIDRRAIDAREISHLNEPDAGA